MATWVLRAHTAFAFSASRTGIQTRVLHAFRSCPRLPSNQATNPALCFGDMIRLLFGYLTFSNIVVALVVEFAASAPQAYLEAGKMCWGLSPPVY
ncbi:unnamed protein product [Schistocephalus solidus]|uniref:Aa_trans domain-containing protein n=1 Tax=Schistocephalus solidus TaxID=70667 RepID=A0A183T5S3_SCHSO|nr:unnamed protein product [Schistocephalus solidus]